MCARVRDSLGMDAEHLLVPSTNGFSMTEKKRVALAGTLFSRLGDCTQCFWK